MVFEKRVGGGGMVMLGYIFRLSIFQKTIEDEKRSNLLPLVERNSFFSEARGFVFYRKITWSCRMEVCSVRNKGLLYLYEPKGTFSSSWNRSGEVIAINMSVHQDKQVISRRRKLMSPSPPWKTSFNGRPSSMEDFLLWKVWKTVFLRRLPSMEDRLL